MQRDLHPTVLSSLEGIVDQVLSPPPHPGHLLHGFIVTVSRDFSQMVWFRENWYEEVLRQLRQALAKCHAVAFDDRSNVAEAAITPHTMSFVRKLVTTFGVGKKL